MHASMKTSRRKEKGFTLIELLVAIAIFVPMILMIVSSFMMLDSARRDTVNKNDLMNQLQYGVNLMGTEITSGSAFPTSCQSGCDTLNFATKVRPDVPQTNVYYTLDTSTHQLVRGAQKTFGLCATLPLDEKCYEPMTSARLDITSAKFFVGHFDAGGKPIVTVVFDGNVGEGKEKEDFHISSSFSPRFTQDPNAQLPADNEPPTLAITQPTNASTYSTGNSTIVLGGTFSDNVGVTEVDWRNEAATNYDGFASVSGTSTLGTWETPVINLVSGVTNNIVITAKDAAGNTTIQTLQVDSTGPPAAPAWHLNYPWATCYYTGIARVYLQWDGPTYNGAYIYRCNGSTCTPTSSDYIGFAQPQWGNGYQDDTTVQGQAYSYAIRVKGLDSQLSPFSNVRSITSPTGCVYTSPSSSGGSSGGTSSGGTSSGGTSSGGTSSGGTSSGGTSSGGTSSGGTSSGGGTGSGGTTNPTVTLTANPIYLQVAVSGSVTAGPDRSSNTTITVNPANGTPGTVSFTATSSVPDIQNFFSPPSVDASSQATSQFYVTVPDATPEGTYKVTVDVDGADASPITLYLSVSVRQGGTL
ncbi:MAG TPA: prepilin-type N-terminal cleavage/methylation domain-containing protein [Candidatus Paceibacterota bacterium]|nr:prepilin-type N-terminal cleavage/methylation domain-containing protein [Candidatus Paceibacterota bacterium]